ncbi:MAG: ABC transporter permease [Candidatus Bathyarchaeia archaeon]
MNFSLYNGFKRLWESYSLQIVILSAYLGLCIAFLILSPTAFLKPATYISILTVAPFTAIIAMGITFVIISGEIDLSFASIAGLGAFAFTRIWLLTHNEALSLLGGLLVGSLAGALNGILVTKAGIVSMIATLGTNFFWRGFIMVLTEGFGSSLVDTSDTFLRYILVGKIGDLPIQVIWSFAILIFFWFILNRHKIGAHIYAVGDNIESAKMMGISPVKAKTIAYIIAGTSSSLVGIMNSLLLLTFWPSTGEGYLLVALAAIFLGGNPPGGGVGTLFGSFIGSYMLGWISTGLIAAGATGFWTNLIYGLTIILSIILYKFARKR